ncbi:leucine-rich_repeat-containing protein [Hexamita inflata]|uniref:Leucine-rich_repeat-containing protein n=1 Tax=Hexamita inflata TaxID=28002 RepID=A0ABP1GDS2_9EUKA
MNSREDVLAYLANRDNKILELKSDQDLKFYLQMNFTEVESQQITVDVSQLQELTHLQLAKGQVYNLHILARIENLQSIQFYNNQISDVSPLSCLKKLEVVYMSVNKIQDVSTLSSILLLRNLHMSQNQIKDLNPISNLTQLTVLELAENQIENIQPLKNLTELVEVNLSKNRLTDIRVISKLNKLQYLTLSNNNITDISCVEGLKYLQQLMLSNNNIVSLAPLAQHSNLLHFYITNNYVSDFSVMQYEAKYCYKMSQKVPSEQLALQSKRQASIFKSENLLEAATQIRFKHPLQPKLEGIRKKAEEQLKSCARKLNHVFELLLSLIAAALNNEKNLFNIVYIINYIHLQS